MSRLDSEHHHPAPHFVLEILPYYTKRQAVCGCTQSCNLFQSSTNESHPDPDSSEQHPQKEPVEGFSFRITDVWFSGKAPAFMKKKRVDATLRFMISSMTAGPEPSSPFCSCPTPTNRIVPSTVYSRRVGCSLAGRSARRNLTSSSLP